MHFLGEHRVPVDGVLSPAILDGDGTTLDPAKFAQSLHKRRDRFARSRKRRRAQEPNGRQLRLQLRVGIYQRLPVP
jgi:hypothetical protein